MRRAAAFFLAVAMAACSSSPKGLESAPAEVTPTKPPSAWTTEALRALLIGRWMGDAPTRGGGHRLWITERKADGTFSISFKISEPGKPDEEQKEFGYWGVSRNVYFTMTRGMQFPGKPRQNADGSDPSLYDAYWIRDLKGDEMTYENIDSGNIFTVKRLSEKAL